MNFTAGFGTFQNIPRGLAWATCNAEIYWSRALNFAPDFSHFFEETSRGPPTSTFRSLLTFRSFRILLSSREEVVISHAEIDKATSKKVAYGGGGGGVELPYEKVGASARRTA